MKLDRNETYLPLLKLTQLKEYSRVLKTTQTYSTQKYSRIRYSTQRLDTQLKDRYSTQRLDTQLKDMILNSKVLNSRYLTQDTQLKILKDKTTIIDAIYGKLSKQ